MKEKYLTVFQYSFSFLNRCFSPHTGQMQYFGIRGLIISIRDQNRRRRREMIGPNKRQAEIVLQKRKVEVAENKFLNVKK